MILCGERQFGRHEWVTTMCALRKTMERAKRRGRTKQRRHPCQDISANPFADQGVPLPPPGPPASLPLFRCCCDSRKSENRGLDLAAVMGVPLFTLARAVSAASRFALPRIRWPLSSKSGLRLLRAWDGVVPGVGLLPVPGGAMLLAALFSVSAHDPSGGQADRLPMVELLTGNQEDAILPECRPGLSRVSRSQATRACKSRSSPSQEQVR